MKISYQGLMNILKMVKFEPTPALLKAYKDAFSKDNLITYAQFQELFKLKLPKETKIQTKNSFRMFTNEFSDNKVDKDKIIELLYEEGQGDEEITYLTGLLPADKNGMIDIEAFVDSTYNN